MRSLVFLLALVPAVYAQGPLMQSINSRYAAVKQNLLETAEVMPEKDYDFRLTPAQRTFGEWIDHTSGTLYNFCSAARGQQAPRSAPAQSKSAIVAKFKTAFEYCDATLKDMTDQKALTEISIGGKPAYPVNALIGLIAGLNEHYGNLVGYMRSKGITPPSTARTQKK